MFSVTHFNFFLAAVMLLLPGCLGSAILFGDEEQGEYGNLASVPDRPAPNNLQSYKEEIKHLKQEHIQAENVNKKIRADYTLTEPKKSEKLQNP